MEFGNHLAIWGEFLRILEYRSSPPYCPLQITHYKPGLIWGSSVVMECPSLMTRSRVGEREEICCLSQATQDT